MILLMNEDNSSLPSLRQLLFGTQKILRMINLTLNTEPVLGGCKFRGSPYFWVSSFAVANLRTLG